jgi:16S rRNA G966 N2-methylase RsmD
LRLCGKKAYLLTRAGVGRTRPIIRYWGRKAGSIAEPYISKYSKPKEIILDAFGGAGNIIRTALLMGRRCIYSDLNPLAALIARVEIEGVDAHALALASTSLLRRQRLYYRDNLGGRHWMSCSYPYEVSCRCGARRQAKYFLWHADTIVAAKVKCSCGDPLIKFTSFETGAINPVYEFPRAILQYSNGLPLLKRRQVNAISELFTQRNLLILSALLKDIKKVRTDGRTKRALLVAFASILYQASKMSRLNGGTWAVNCYWIPKVHVERNPYFLFKDALKRLSRIKGFAVACTSAEPVINGDAPLAILTSDAKELPLPDNSVDLVITDPPFTDEIQYFELSYMAASWLGLPMPFDKEIVVNHRQGKKLNDYYRLLSKSFAELHRVLKPGRMAIIMLHDENEEILNELIELVEGAGFIIDKRKKERMVVRQVGDRNSLKGRDLLVLSCHKP